MTKPRVLIWDLETGGVNAFKADLGFILNFGYKWLGEKKVTVLKASDYKDWFEKTRPLPVNDKPLLEAALKIMFQADMLVAHYGDRFDRRFFQGRCAILDLPPPPPTIQRDTWRIARGAFAFSSNRLGNLAKTFNLTEKKQEKTAFQWPGWWLRSMAGDKTALEEMAVYCAQDVRTTEKLYLRTRVYDNMQHPRLHPNRANCKLCGGSVHYEGFRTTTERKYKRYRCVDCGRWGHESKAEPRD